jgi:hypothetical protein
MQEETLDLVNGGTVTVYVFNSRVCMSVSGVEVQLMPPEVEWLTETMQQFAKNPPTLEVNT